MPEALHPRKNKTVYGPKKLSFTNLVIRNSWKGSTLIQPKLLEMASIESFDSMIGGNLTPTIIDVKDHLSLLKTV